MSTSTSRHESNATIGAGMNGGAILNPHVLSGDVTAPRPVSAMSKLKTMFGTKKAPMPFGERTPATTPSPQVSPVIGPSPVDSIQNGKSSTNDGVKKMSPSPSIQKMSPSPSIQKISPSPSIQKISPSPSIQKISPSPSIHNDKPSTNGVKKISTSFSIQNDKTSTNGGGVHRKISASSSSLSNMLLTTTNISNGSSSNSSSTVTSPIGSSNYTTLPQAVNSSSTSVHSMHSAGGTRIIIHDDGTHEHHLKSTRRQEKLGRMIRDIIGTGQKVRNDAVSAMPDFVDKHSDDDSDDTKRNSLTNNLADLSLMSGLVSQIERGEKDVKNIVRDGGLNIPAPVSTTVLPTTATTTTNASAQSTAPKSLIQKYGKCQEIIGKGAYGVVRVSHKYDQIARREVLFAVKEFKRRPSENEQHFSKRLTSEFCISSSLHHVNIIQTLDLMKDARGVCCQVMEYCAGGDLYSLILASDGGLEPLEANCFFKQIMRGVVYMHSMGVAHCDLKPENILLTPTGAVKISDFGNGECFRMAWESEVHLLTGVCGSKPYIAPEEFREKAFDPRAVDIWATGVIYMAMRTGSYLWQVAVPEEDEFYAKYLQGRKHKNGYEPIEMLKRSRCKNVIYSILDPMPNRRITGKQVLNSEWGRSINVCKCGEEGH